MILKFYLSFLFLLILALQVLKAQQVISSASASAVGSGVQLSWTAGEPVIETFSGTGIILTQGFHQGKLGVTAIDDVAVTGIKISVFPNPVTQDLKLEITGIPSEKVDYKLFDLDGRLLFTKKTEKQPELINMGIFPSGFYFLRIFLNEKQPLQTFKIIKN